MNIPPCESEQQHVVTLVRNKGLSQLDKDNMWRSWYELTYCCRRFNHGEARTCFERAVQVEPGCALAHWAAAHSLCCNYNKCAAGFEHNRLPRKFIK